MNQSLGRRHAAEIDSCQDRREGSIDEGAIYDDVDVVKAIAKDGRSDRDRNGRDQGYENRIPGPLMLIFALCLAEALCLLQEVALGRIATLVPHPHWSHLRVSQAGLYPDPRW